MIFLLEMMRLAHNLHFALSTNIGTPHIKHASIAGTTTMHTAAENTVAAKLHKRKTHDGKLKID